MMSAPWVSPGQYDVSEAFIVAPPSTRLSRELVANDIGRNVHIFRLHINGKCSIAKGLLARWGLKRHQ